MENISTFIAHQRKLKIDKSRSAVEMGRASRLGFHNAEAPRKRIAPKARKRFKDRLLAGEIAGTRSVDRSEGLEAGL